jgi:hypothetical protein
MTDVRRHLGDDAGDLAAGYEGQRRLDLVLTGEDESLREPQTAILHVDPCMPGFELGPWHIGQRKTGGLTEV